MGSKPTKKSLTDDSGNAQFFKDERAIWWSKNLTGNEKAFYAQLKSFYFKGKPTFPTITTICNLLDMSKPTAYKCRRRLQELGLISWTTERGRKHACKYRFILETGNKTEKAIAYDNLMADKIVKNRTSSKSRKIVKNNTLKIVKNQHSDSYKGKRIRERKQQQGTQESPKPGKSEKEMLLLLFSDLPKNKKQKTFTNGKIFTLAEYMMDGGDVSDDVKPWMDFMAGKVEAVNSNGGMDDESVYWGSMLKKYRDGEITENHISKYNEKTRKTWDWDYVAPMPEQVKGVPMADNLKKKSGYGTGELFW